MVYPFFRVDQPENMGDIAFGRSDTARIFAFQDIFHPVRQFQLVFFDDFLVSDDVDGNIGVNETQQIEIYVDMVIDFDEILLAHRGRGRVHHKSRRVMRLVKPQPVKNTNTLPGFDVINDDTVIYLSNVKHFSPLCRPFARDS
jgi:hypothetical protein